jgi:hypothetical protein
MDQRKDSFHDVDNLATAASEQTVQKEDNNTPIKAKGPEVVVFSEAPRKAIAGSSKAHYKAFMVSVYLPTLPFPMYINTSTVLTMISQLFYICSHQR